MEFLAEYLLRELDEHGVVKALRLNQGRVRLHDDAGVLAVPNNRTLLAERMKLHIEAKSVRHITDGD